MATFGPMTEFLMTQPWPMVTGGMKIEFW